MCAGCWGIWGEMRGVVGEESRWEWIDGGKEAPQWRTVPLSASCNDFQLLLVDVEVSEEVEGCTEGPARLHVVHLLGQLLNRTRGSPSKPHGNVFSYSSSRAHVSVSLPAARCSPWSQSPLLAGTWCTSCPCRGRGWWHRIWSSCCTLKTKDECSWPKPSILLFKKKLFLTTATYKTPFLVCSAGCEE